MAQPASVPEIIPDLPALAPDLKLVKVPTTRDETIAWIQDQVDNGVATNYRLEERLLSALVLSFYELLSRAMPAGAGWRDNLAMQPQAWRGETSKVLERGERLLRGSLDLLAMRLFSMLRQVFFGDVTITSFPAVVITLVQWARNQKNPLEPRYLPVDYYLELPEPIKPVTVDVLRASKEASTEARKQLKDLFEQQSARVQQLEQTHGASDKDLRNQLAEQQTRLDRWIKLYYFMLQDESPQRLSLALPANADAWPEFQDKEAEALGKALFYVIRAQTLDRLHFMGIAELEGVLKSLEEKESRKPTMPSFKDMLQAFSVTKLDEATVVDLDPEVTVKGKKAHRLQGATATLYRDQTLAKILQDFLAPLGLVLPDLQQMATIDIRRTLQAWKQQAEQKLAEMRANDIISKELFPRFFAVADRWLRPDVVTMPTQPDDITFFANNHLYHDFLRRLMERVNTLLQQTEAAKATSVVHSEVDTRFVHLAQLWLASKARETPPTVPEVKGFSPAQLGVLKQLVDLRETQKKDLDKMVGALGLGSKSFVVSDEFKPFWSSLQAHLTRSDTTQEEKDKLEEKNKKFLADKEQCERDLKAQKDGNAEGLKQLTKHQAEITRLNAAGQKLLNDTQLAKLALEAERDAIKNEYTAYKKEVEEKVKVELADCKKKLEESQKALAVERAKFQDLDGITKLQENSLDLSNPQQPKLSADVLKTFKTLDTAPLAPIWNLNQATGETNRGVFTGLQPQARAAWLVWHWMRTRDYPLVEARIREIEGQLTTCRAELATCTRELETTKRDLATCLARPAPSDPQELARLREQLATCTTELQKATQDLAARDETLQKANADLKQTVEFAQRYKQERDKLNPLQKRTKDLETELAACKHELEVCLARPGPADAKELEDLRRAIEERTKELDNCIKELDKARKELRACEQAADAARRAESEQRKRGRAEERPTPGLRPSKPEHPSRRRKGEDSSSSSGTEGVTEGVSKVKVEPDSKPEEQVRFPAGKGGGGVMAPKAEVSPARLTPARDRPDTKDLTPRERKARLDAMSARLRAAREGAAAKESELRPPAAPMQSSLLSIADELEDTPSTPVQLDPGDSTLY